MWLSMVGLAKNVSELSLDLVENARLVVRMHIKHISVGMLMVLRRVFSVLFLFFLLLPLSMRAFLPLGPHSIRTMAMTMAVIAMSSKHLQSFGNMASELRQIWQH